MTAGSKGIALVTGAAQGIGRAIALRLASDGFHVAVNDISSKQSLLDDVAQVANDKGSKTLSISADVGDEGQVQGMINNVVNKLGGLDVMIANAGIATFSPMTTSSTNHFDSTFRINVRGTYLCYKYAALQMIEQNRGGRIIGASSVAGKRGFVGLGAYSATKFAIHGLTQTAALELGRHGITVNSYAPGIISTPIWKSVFNPEVPVTMQEYFKEHIKDAPVGYTGQPADVASIVSYLASKEAHFVTGQSFSVDGGMALN
ncbi:hypothetical protein BJ138DRAFT_1162916 [Hygrophoropsis aurantiaca]|uniref:Uncharacterized protein n=1 Tax=Hygrophoropsis aurantiaca TaxID=72124 RepID=A0ACB7ZYT1_9AGAM|nr:hypothetical protein BJ138DRAFT_1162916 [Hygrophoropsis aurantiaca]